MHRVHVPHLIPSDHRIPWQPHRPISTTTNTIDDGNLPPTLPPRYGFDVVASSGSQTRPASSSSRSSRDDAEPMPLDAANCIDAV